MNKIPSWVWFVALAGGAYAVYRLFDKANKLITTVTDPVANVIASPIILMDQWLHPDRGNTTAGSIVLPNGVLVPTTQIRAYIDSPTGQTRVNYQGRIYALSPHNSAGNWPATLVG